jgi:hypothetical protein
MEYTLRHFRTTVQHLEAQTHVTQRELARRLRAERGPIEAVPHLH